MTTINAENLILGKLATNVAKRLISGETITIANAEKAVMLGTKEAKAYKFKKRLGIAYKGMPERGPKYSNRPETIMRYAIRGMLPTERASGRDAFRRLKVYSGLPLELKDRNLKTVPDAKCKSDRFVYLEEVCKHIGYEAKK